MMSTRTSYFDDFQTGQEVETPARTITEADIVAFSGLSGDYNALHTDSVFAAKGPYGKRIAQGLLGLSVTSGLIARLGILEEAVLAFREVKWKFKKPVFIGDTIFARVKVISTKFIRRFSGGLVELAIRLYNQHQQIVQIGTWKVLLRTRESTQDDD